MGKEIERKFLLDKPIPWDLGQHRIIKQGYIFVEKNKHIRIRLIHDQAFLCLKYTGNEIRDEYEYEIPLIDGLEIFNKCKLKLEKIRHTISPLNQDYTVDIDRYPNNLIVAEVEFKSIQDSQKFLPFEWFGEEISGRKEYSNITLAKQKLHF